MFKVLSVPVKSGIERERKRKKKTKKRREREGRVKERHARYQDGFLVSQKREEDGSEREKTRKGR